MEEFAEEQQQHIDQLIADEKVKWEAEQLAPVIAERDELMKFKPKELTDQEKEIARLKAELQHSKLVQSLEKSNLSDFVDFISVEDEKDLPDKIDKLNAVLEARRLDNSFVPDQHRQTNPYDTAAKNNDVIGMIGAKINKLFN